VPANSIDELTSQPRLGRLPGPPRVARRRTPVLDSARAARQWVRQRRELRMLEALYPSISRSLGLDPDWRVHRVLPTVGDITVCLVGGPTPVAVLKCARSDRGTTALETSGAVVESLVDDPRLAAWAHLLPRRLATAHAPDGLLVVLEQLKPGIDARALALPDTEDTVVESILDTVTAIHDRTSVPATIDQDLLRLWVDEPIQALTSWYGDEGGARRAGLERLRRVLHHRLAGRDVRMGWIHGDLAPGNVLLQHTALDSGRDRLEVSALLDWERATSKGLPDLDVVHLHLTTRMLIERRELGALVVDLLENPPEASNEAVSDPGLVLLAWLHHVSGIVTKSSSARPRGMWAARNVDPVLALAASWEQWDHRGEPSGLPARIGRATTTWLPWAAMAAAVLLWVVALPRVDTSNMNDLGLVPRLPWQWFAAMAVMAVGFGMALGRRSVKGPLAAYPVVLTALFYLTPPILYEAPRYFWAWKHAGIVDYIYRHGAVDPRIDVLPVYHNWPGFFALNGMLTDLAGLRTPLSYVAWAETFFNVLTVAAVTALLRYLTGDVRTAALGAWLFTIGNWVGQGYWSPQALALVWYLLAITILLRWFPVLLTRPRPATAAQRVGLMVVVLLLLGSIVSTHQLTPVALILTTAALVLLRRTDALVIPLLAVVMLGTWLLYVAAPFTSSNLSGILSAVGAVDRNVNGTLIGYAQVSTGVVVVSLMARGVTLTIGALAGFGFLKELRVGRVNATAFILAAAPVSLVAFSPYGSEILFRSYLFALPGLVYFAAVFLWPPGTVGARTRRLVIVGSSLALMLGFVFAQFGNDRRYHFTDAEIAGADYVYRKAPPHSLLIEGSHNYPAEFENYEKFTYVTMDLEEPPTRKAIAQEPVEVLTSWMQNPQYAAAYLIITRSQKAETNATAGLPGRGLPGIERALARSPKFRVVFRNRDAVVFVLSQRTAGPSPVSSPGGSR
jgi:phosphotransferase family enzyme